MSNPVVLDQLSPREAILDTIHRAVLGFDNNDPELFSSALFKENTSFSRNGQVHEGFDAVMEKIFGEVAKLETHHIITNSRIELRGDGNTAHMVMYMEGQHHRPGEAMDPSKTGLNGGTTNVVDLARDGQLWKVTNWAMNINWIEGDASIVGLPGH